MAIYHLDVKLVQRSKGQSVVAAAAYRSGTCLHDASLGKDQNYSSKKGVQYSEILAPLSSPTWVKNHEQLWNAVEQFEKRKDARLAREMVLDSPVELTR